MIHDGRCLPDTIVLTQILQWLMAIIKYRKHLIISNSYLQSFLLKREDQLNTYCSYLFLHGNTIDVKNKKVTFCMFMAIQHKF